MWWLSYCVNLRSLLNRSLSQLAHQFHNLGCRRPTIGWFIPLVRRENGEWMAFSFFGDTLVFAFVLDVISWLLSQAPAYITESSAFPRRPINLLIQICTRHCSEFKTLDWILQASLYRYLLHSSLSHSVGDHWKAIL